MFKMVTMFMIVSFFTAYGNNVVLNESNIQISKTSKKDVKKVEYQKQNLYGADRTVKRQLSSNLKVKKKLNNKVNLKDGKGQVSAAQLNQSAKPKEGAIIKERYVSNKKLNVGPRKSISESQISRNTRDHETLFFSEYAEGTSYNKYFEIYNGTGSDVDLSGYAFPSVSNDQDDAQTYDFWNTFSDGATIADGDVYVVCNGQADASILVECDQTWGFFPSGDDALGLVQGTADSYTVIDVIGDNFTSSDYERGPWDVAGTSNSTQNKTIVRKPSVAAGNSDWDASAGTNVDDSEWIVYDSNTWTNLGSHEVEQEDGPYLSEGFEGDVFPPTDWDMVSFDDYGYSTTAGWAVGDASTSCFSGACGPGSPNSGDAAAYYDVYSFYYDANSMLITPSIDLSGATAPKLSFYLWDEYHSSSYGYPLEVFISTDGGASFGSAVYQAPTASFPNFVTNGWEKIDVDLSGYVGQSIHIGFKSTSDWGSDNPHLDDIVVEEPPTYPIAGVSTEIIDFGVIKVTDTKTESFSVNNTGGAALSWTALSDGSLFTISSSSGSVDPGAMADISVTYTPTSAGVIDTAYVIITHDAESSPDSVFLIGSAHNDLYRTSFEEPWSVATDTRPSSPPGWSHIKVSGEGGWGQYSTISATDGGNVARAYYSGTNDDDVDLDGVADNPGEHLLISPALDLSSGSTGFKLTFDALSSSYTETRLEVQISSQNTDASSGWTTLGSYVYGDNLTTSMSEQAISLSDYSDGTYYIGFRMFDENGYYIYVDDVKVEPLPETAELSVAATDLPYPATPIGSTVSETITITNTGAVTLTGTITYPDGFTGPADFSTDDNVDVAISYSPTTAGLHSGSVVITSNGGDASILVTGAAGGSVATWDIDYDGDGYEDWPLGWDWVNYDGGTQEWDFMDYSRTGTGNAGVRYEGSALSNDDWLISPQLDVVAGDKFVFFARGLSSFYTESFNVMLSTTGANDVTSFDVTLLSDAAMSTDYVSFEIDLSAYVGTQPRIAIQYTALDQYYFFVDDIATSATYVPSGPALTDYYSSVDYGNILAGGTSSFNWDYVNGGGADLEVTAVDFSNTSFSLPSDISLPVVTVPGAVGGFDVVFSPPADVDASYSGTMTVTHNGGDPIVVNVSGYGLFATYVENFDNLSEGTDLPSGWTSMDDTDANSWVITATGGTSNFLFHSDGISGIATQYDTVVTSAISLPAVVDYHYELEFSDYVNYGTWSNYSGIHISQDGGLTWTEIYESDYIDGWDTGLVLDLTGFDGGDVHLAIVYVGAYDHAYGVDDLIIRSKPDPIIPILSASSFMVFPATAIGEQSTKWLYFQNTGSGDYSGTVTYPGGLSGETSITGLAEGTEDSIAVAYMPTTQGIMTGSIVFDGSSSGAAEVSVPVEGNAGVQGATFEDSWIGWDDYSLVGYPSTSGTPDTWLWFGGSGHSGPNYAGVYSHTGNWGGVNDFLVSPKLEVESGDMLSFWAKGGYGLDCAYGTTLGINTDSVVVWVSTEMPIMGMNNDGIDTGFVNTDAFTAIGGGTPSCDTWDAHSYDLSNYAGDAWVLIQSAKAGWMLKIDDVAYPDMYKNPNPVLYVGKEYDFGVTQPTGDSVRYYLRNTGGQDLIIDNMEFENGEYFDVSYNSTFPITITPGGIDSIDVYWMPEMEGFQRDTLVYTSNYTVGDYDAFGRGTDHSVFTADAFNAPPGAVMLLAPDPTATPLVTIDANNATGSTDFFWTNTSDPDGTPIEYIFEIMVPGDTLDTLLSSNSFSLDHSEVVELMEELSVTSFDATWDVHAYDGFEATGSSNGPWALSFDAGWVLGGLDNNTIPDVFALHNNYPNPFNPVTNIRYDIPVASDVRIDIYNIAGEKVRTLVSREHQPGRYKIQWNATNEFGSPVATGMYIYKIHAKDFVSVKKLLLMK